MSRRSKQNLVALGYKGFTVDDVVHRATADAVRAWQADLGLSETGTVDASQVVVAPGPIRVAAVKASVGVRPPDPCSPIPAPTRVVDIDLDVSKQHLVEGRHPRHRHTSR